GTISVQSELGKGSIFTLFLPLTQTSTPADFSDLKIPQQLQSHPKKPASETSVAPKDDDRHNINADDQVMLIVEDDSRFIKIMIDKAHEHGLKAVVAT